MSGGHEPNKRDNYEKNPKSPLVACRRECGVLSGRGSFEVIGDAIKGDMLLRIKVDGALGPVA